MPCTSPGVVKDRVQQDADLRPAPCGVDVRLQTGVRVVGRVADRVAEVRMLGVGHSLISSFSLTARLPFYRKHRRVAK